MTRKLAVTRALFTEYFEKKPWTAGNVVHKNEYVSKMEFSDVVVRDRLGRFLTEQRLNFRSPLYRLHLIMVPEIMDDEAFKEKVLAIMAGIGVQTTFTLTCTRGESSYMIGKVYAREVELIEFCDIQISGVPR